MDPAAADNCAEDLLREVRKVIPTARLGFPPPEDVGRLRQKQHAAHVRRWNRLEAATKARFQKVKETALASNGRNKDEDHRL
jgi:hypothetical protein